MATLAPVTGTKRFSKPSIVVVKIHILYGLSFLVI